MEKNIMVFGDSNTWGYSPLSYKEGACIRFDRETRWTGRLQEKLGPEYYVLEEGLNGRTTVWEDPIEEHKCGKEQLIPLLNTHNPLDLIIIMLGTNDLKMRFNVAAIDIANSVGLLVEKVFENKNVFRNEQVKVLVIAPAPTNLQAGGPFTESFAGAQEKSKLLGHLYQQVAESYGVDFVDAGKYMTAHEADGLHLGVDAHRLLAEVVYEKVMEIL